MMSHPLQELHRGWLSPLQCRTDAVQSRNLEEGDCTKRALTVEHMATNICKNVSPVNRLAAKSSCNWWLRGRGHNHLRINRCHPLALTSFCFFFTVFFPPFHSFLSTFSLNTYCEHNLELQGSTHMTQYSAIRTQKFIFYSFCGCHSWPYVLEQSECSLFPWIAGGAAALWFITGIKSSRLCCDVTRAFATEILSHLAPAIFHTSPGASSLISHAIN